MDYPFFLFSKLYSYHFYEDNCLEYDLLFDKLVTLYKDFENSEHNTEKLDLYTCMNIYLECLKFKLEYEQHK